MVKDNARACGAPVRAAADAADRVIVYHTGAAFDEVAGFEPGTAALVSGDEHRAREEVYDALVTGSDADGVVVVTTERTAAEVVADLESRGGVDRSRLGVVQVGAETGAPDGVAVESVGSAGDLTGVSLATAKLIRRLGAEDAGRVRVGVVSVSKLLLYAELETVFRFLHVLTARTSGGGWLGLFAIDPSAHDTQTVSTIRAAFEAELDTDAGGGAARGAGIVRE